MRGAAVSLLALLLTDVSPKDGSFREVRWAKGDFVAAANEPLNRSVMAGDVVGIQLSGRRESCLLRRKIFPLRFPCRLRFRVRWSDARFEHAFPSVHVLFNPPALKDGWWKDPVSPADHQWRDARSSLLFHFSTDRHWRRFGVTSSLEEAPGWHDSPAPEKTWTAVEFRLEEAYVAVFMNGRQVAHSVVDLGHVKTFTYGIGDQTSTFVELDDFSYEPGR